MTPPTIPGLADGSEAPKLTEIGRGASSTVYAAEHVAHGRRVAIKVLNTVPRTDRERLAFERELQAMGRLADHPHIVDLLQSGFTDEGQPFLMMPFYRKGNYAARVDHNGRLGWEEVIDFGIKVASALHTAHGRGIVHRDIKPANIFAAEFPRHPILADFGISSFTKPSLDGTPTVGVSTTPLFAAPEVLNGERPTEASDVYSFGATLYALAVGEAAYSHSSTDIVVARVMSDARPPEPPGDLPADLSNLIVSLIAKDRAVRPSSALEVAQSLASLQERAGLPPTPIITDEQEEGGGGSLPTPSATTGPNDRATDGDPSATLVPQVDTGPIDTGPINTGPINAGAPIPARAKVAAAEAVGVGPGRAASPSGSGGRRVKLGDQATREVDPLDRPPEPGTAVPDDPRPAAPPSSPRRWPLAIGALVVLLLGAVGVAYAAEIGPFADNEEGTGGETSAPAPAVDETLTQMSVTDAHDGAVRAVAAGRSPGLVATGGDDAQLKLWRDESDGSLTLLSTLDFSGWVLALAWSPDGERLAVGTSDGTIAVTALDLEEEAAEEEVRFRLEDTTIEAIAWSPDGNRLAVGAGDGTLSIWTDSGEQQVLLEAHSPAALAVGWAPDGTQLVSGGKDARLRFSDAETGAELNSIQHEEWVRSLDWSPDGQTIATAAPDGTARTWDAATGERLTSDRQDADLTGSVRWSPDGELLAVGSVEGALTIWDPSSGESVLDTVENTSSVLALSWHETGTQLSIGRADGTVEVWARATS